MSTNDASSPLLLRDMLVELVQLGTLDLLTEEVALDPPRQDSAGLVLHVGASGYGKDVVEFFERALFGLGHPVGERSAAVRT